MSAHAETLLRSLSPIFAIIVLLIFAAVAVPAFFNPFNLSSIGFQYSVLGIIALGQFAAVVVGGIDLSQGATIGFVAVVTALAIQAFGNAVGIALGLVAGLSIGVLNGLLIAYSRIPAFIVTLGTMGIARGLALAVSGGVPIALSERSLVTAARMRIMDLPVTFAAFLLAAVLLAAFLTFWPEGRRIYAVGGHEENARLSGLPVRKIKLLVYIFSGLTGGISGVIVMARLGTGHPLAGTNYELISISAVILGGASLTGGSGRIPGLVSAVLLLGIIDSLINLSGLSPYLQGSIKGVIVLGALILSRKAAQDVSA